MDYDTLLDFAMKLGYRLAMSGAETFRVEDSVSRVMAAYGVSAETFAIPNLIIINIATPDGQALTRMRRIGYHGNDLDSVERYSNLSRKVCAETPEPAEAVKWLRETEASCRKYSLPGYLVGNFLGACGFAVFFGGNLIDSLCAGVCGILVGLVNRLMDTLKVNMFFSTIASAFIFSLAAYAMSAIGIAAHVDAVIIGVLMILVPGLLFTNAMRDIIFGDTNSGINRIVQVLLIAAAIAIGTGAAWGLSFSLFPTASTAASLLHPGWLQCVASFVGCIGFSILFNIHGPGVLLCALGGFLAWGAYCITFSIFQNEIMSNFIAAVVASIYAELMARIRKFPAISYLVVSIFPLLPGAGIYYTTNHLVQGNMASFTDSSMSTVAIAGALAVGILIVSTTVRFWGVRKQNRKA